MELIYWEIKKILNQRKMIMIIPILLGISIFFKSNDYKSYDYISTEEYQIYQTYINVFGGMINEKTMQGIEEKDKEISSVPQKVLKAKNDLQNKDIDIDTYKEIVSMNAQLQYHNTAMNMIKSQVDSQKQSLNNRRYLINEYSWVDYFSQSLDFFWLFTLLTFTLVVFANLESKGKDEVISSTYKGRSKMVLSKYVVSILVFTILFVIFEIVNAYVYLKEVNFEELSYPIQSISIFVQSSYNVSIQEFIVFGLLLKYIGSFSMLVFISLLFIKLKKEVIAIFIIIITSIMFTFALNRNPVLTLLSFVSLLTPYKLFNAQNDIKNDFIYHPIGLSAIVFITFMVIVLVIIYIVNIKKIQVKKLKLLSCVLLILLFGCQDVNKHLQPSSIYNFQEQSFIQENETIKVFKMQGDYLFIKDDKDDYSIANHLDYDDDKMIVATYLDEDDLYYLKTDDNMMGYEIIKVDLDDYSRSTFYDKTVSTSSNFLSFLPNLKLEKEIFIKYPQLFAVYDNRLVEVMHNAINIVDLKTNDKQIINDFIGLDEIVLDANKIYYLNTKNELMYYDVLTQKNEQVMSHLVASFRFDENAMYYISLENNNYLYKQVNAKDELLIKQKIESFSLTSEGIYFLSKEDLKPYYYDFKSKEVQMIGKESLMEIKGSKDHYYTYKYENRIKIEECKQKCELLFDDYEKSMDGGKQ